MGGVAFVVDLGLFNLLRFGPGEVLGHKPLTAQGHLRRRRDSCRGSGNRHWTFSQQRTERRTRELAVFAIVNVVGAAHRAR